jgi:carbon monoxide dehydrogenase subunit G
VTIRTSVGTSVRLSVGKSTSITRNGATVTLKDVALNDSVTAHYKVSRLSVTTLAASGPAVTTTSGRASTMSTAGGTIALASTTLQTNANTRISRNGTIVGLRQLTLKDALVAHVATGTNVALDILSDGPDEGEVQGVISAISGNDVTITPGGAAPQVTVVVGASTLIEIEDASGTLADLAVGQSVEAEYDPTTLAAFSIDVSNEGEDGEVQGTVAAVDTATGTVTITPQGGGANITLTVNASTELDVNDEGGTLADLQIGMPIKAEYDTVTLLASEIEAGGSDDSGDSEGSDD